MSRPIAIVSPLTCNDFFCFCVSHACSDSILEQHSVWRWTKMRTRTTRRVMDRKGAFITQSNLYYNPYTTYMLDCKLYHCCFRIAPTNIFMLQLNNVNYFADPFSVHRHTDAFPASAPARRRQRRRQTRPKSDDTAVRTFAERGRISD